MNKIFLGSVSSANQLCRKLEEDSEGRFPNALYECIKVGKTRRRVNVKHDFMAWERAHYPAVSNEGSRVVVVQSELMVLDTAQVTGLTTNCKF